MAGLQGFKIFEFEEMPCAIVFDPVSPVLIAAPRPLGCETMEAVAASISAYRASLPPAQATKQTPRALSLMVAQECNLNCSYCFASQGTYGGPPKHMDLEVAKASVDFLLKGIGQGETASIILFGGEPLMNFEAIQVLVQHSERVAAAQGKFVAFSMTTNGTLLTEEALRFCREHKIALMVSVDGPPDIQDVQRPCRNPTESSSRLVEQNMAYIREYYGGRIPFPARVTVTPRLPAGIRGPLHQDPAALRRLRWRSRRRHLEVQAAALPTPRPVDPRRLRAAGTGRAAGRGPVRTDLRAVPAYFHHRGLQPCSPGLVPAVSQPGVGGGALDRLVNSSHHVLMVDKCYRPMRRPDRFQQAGGAGTLSEASPSPPTPPDHPTPLPCDQQTEDQLDRGWSPWYK